MRAQAGYRHTYYELGKEFAGLDAHGTAEVASLGLSWPLVRTQTTRLALGLSYLYKELEDHQDATGLHNSKHSELLPLTLAFHHRDRQGITYGSLTYTAGNLKLDEQLRVIDRISGTDTRGHFDKWNLDLARLQRTGIAGLTLFGRGAFQWAGENLDSSESFLPGGARGVRAYPQAEGAGDEGWLVQLEARYRLNALEPFLFYDASRVWLNARDSGIQPPVTDNTRTLAGAGVGVRYNRGPLDISAALAWRTRGGEPEAETRDRNPRLWASAVWHF